MPLRSRPRAQFHFHSPSEHTINGKHYPLEMHMVHKLFTSDGTLGGTVTNSAGKMAKAAVIGIMFEYSPTDADGDFLSKFQPVFQNMRQFKQFDSTNIEVEDEDAQFSLMDDVFGVIGTDQYYHYNGSLTTVNCYDSISWFNSALPSPRSARVPYSRARAPQWPTRCPSPPSSCCGSPRCWLSSREATPAAATTA
jgi:carbonic anhydrase